MEIARHDIARIPYKNRGGREQGDREHTQRRRSVDSTHQNGCHRIRNAPTHKTDRSDACVSSRTCEAIPPKAVA